VIDRYAANIAEYVTAHVKTILPIYFVKYLQYPKVFKENILDFDDVYIMYAYNTNLLCNEFFSRKSLGFDARFL
jgi:hypothetical protein